MDGKQQKDDKLKVSIPASVEEGMALRIPGNIACQAMRQVAKSVICM